MNNRKDEQDLSHEDPVDLSRLQASRGRQLIGTDQVVVKGFKPQLPPGQQYEDL